MPDPQTPRHPRSRLLDLPALAPLAVVLVGVLLYGHTLHAPWYFDDRGVVLNPGSVGDAWAALFGQRGLAHLSFALNRYFGGVNPVGYHLVNIAIHLAAALLVLLLLRRVFPRQPWAPLFGALLFVAHPVQTQAVTYVVQRMASLSALCSLLSLYLFVRSRERLAAGEPFTGVRHLACYLGALLAGLLAILAKENAVLLPLALLLFARFFLTGTETRWRPLLLSLTPFCLAPLCFGWLFFVAPLLRGMPIARMGSATVLANLQGATPLRYLVTEFSVLWIYIRLLFLPWGQALDPGYPLVSQLLTLQNLAAGFGLAGLLLLAFRLRHQQPAISAGILWFFLMLAAESSIIPLDPLMEHRLYLPFFAFSLILPALVNGIPKPALRQGVMLVTIVILALLTWQRNALWNDPIALYEDNLRQAPNNERVCNDLASYYLQAGRPPELAQPLLERTVQLNPRYALPYKTLADIYVAQGRLSDARRLLEQGIRTIPAKGAWYEYLAWLYAQGGDQAAAYAILQRGLQADPMNGLLHVGMGRALLERGDAAAAEPFLRRGIALGEGDAATRALLMRALQMQRKGSAASP